MPDWLSSRIVINGFLLPFSVLDFLFRFVLPGLVGLGIYFVLMYFFRRLMRFLVKDGRLAGRISRNFRLLFSVLLFLFLLSLLVAILGQGIFSNLLGRIFVFINTPFISSESSRISVMTLLWVFGIFWISSALGRVINSRLKDSYLVRFGLSDVQSFTFRRLLRYGVVVVAFLLGLSFVGIDLSAVGVILGVLGVGIGFGLQSLVGDIVAGISLIGMGLIKEGDLIRVEGFNGTIRHIRLINTELVTFENEALIIPNHLFTRNIIHNLSYKDKRLVVVNTVDVDYGSNLDEVIEVLSSIALRNPWLDVSRRFLVRVVEFADSGITFQLRIWIKDIAHWGEARSWTNLEIWRDFAKHDIEIPFPQRVIHERKDTAGGGDEPLADS